MEKKLIYKFSNILNNALNEAFDFNKVENDVTIVDNIDGSIKSNNHKHNVALFNSCDDIIKVLEEHYNIPSGLSSFINHNSIFTECNDSIWMLNKCAHSRAHRDIIADIKRSNMFIDYTLELQHITDIGYEYSVRGRLSIKDVVNFPETINIISPELRLILLYIYNLTYNISTNHNIADDLANFNISGNIIFSLSSLYVSKDNNIIIATRGWHNRELTPNVLYIWITDNFNINANNYDSKLEQNLIYKLNEAFDFDEELSNTTIESTMIDIADTAILFATRNLNTQISLDDIFYGLFKIKPPFRSINSIAKIKSIGNVWYAPKYWDPEKVICLRGKKVKNYQNYYDSLSINSNKINYNTLVDAGWEIYATERMHHSRFDMPNSIKSPKPLNAGVIQILNVLSKNLGIPYINWNNLYSSEDIMTAFAVSPDNGIIILDYMIAPSDDNAMLKSEYKRTHNDYTYIKVGASGYTSIVLYTGLVEYKINLENIEQNKNDLADINREKSFIKSLGRTVGFSFPWFNPHLPGIDNTYMLSFIKSDSGDLILVAGSTNYPFGIHFDSLKHSRTINYDKQKIKTEFPTKSPKQIQKWVNIGMSPTTYSQDFWEIIVNTPKMIVWEYTGAIQKTWDQRRLVKGAPGLKGKVKIFQTTDLNIIRKLVGDAVADECQKRPIVLEFAGKHYKDDQDITICYKFIWFDDEILELYKSNKGYSMKPEYLMHKFK